MKSSAILVCCLSIVVYSHETNAGGNYVREDALRNIAVKVSDLERELHLLKETSALQQKTVSGLEKVVMQQEQAIMALEEENINIKKRQRLNGEVAFTAFDTEEMAYSVGETILFRHEVIDIGGYYDPNLSQFTCPVSGIYMFSVYSLCAGGAVSDVCIVIGQIEYAGYHINADNDTGKMGTALFIGQCNEGEIVLVRAKTSGTRLVGRIEENWTHGFSGALLAYFG